MEELQEEVRRLSCASRPPSDGPPNGTATPSYPPDRDSLFRLLTENSRDVITRHAADGTLLYVSPAVTSLLGYAPEDLWGRSALEFVSVDDAALLRAAIIDSLRNGRDEFTVEHKLQRKDGEKVWAETRGVLLMSAGNELLEIHCSVRDVDDRKKAQAQVSMMQSAIENMSVAVYWMAEDGGFLYVNRAACDSLGYTRDELSNMKLWEIDPDFSAEKWQGQWQRLRELKHDRIETFHRTKDGRKYPVEIMVDHTDIGDREIHWAFARDISLQKSAEEAMNQMEQRLRQAEKMEAIGLLAGGIAHDFNNQLAGLLGYADLLRDEVLEPALIDYVDSIILGIKRASGLTEQLLAFSRRGKYRSVPVNMNIIVKEVGSILRHSIDKKIVIRNRLCAGAALTMGDPSQLQNAVLNLAINARDAMPVGGTLTFYTEKLFLDAEFCDAQPYVLEPGHYVRVAVADTGVGMSEEVRNHAFEPFFTTKEKGKGTGMGLAAVYGTVKNHKGAVNIYSEIGQGTEVKIFLPAAEQDVVHVEENTEAVISPRSPINVLLVEDEAVLIEVATAMLNRIGCTVSVCNNGQEAVSTYEALWREIDLVILDMVMPIMNGREAFDAMRQINPAVVAVLASGYSLDGEAQQLLADGVRGFIQKPYRKNDLARIIAEAMPADS